MSGAKDEIVVPLPALRGAFIRSLERAGVNEKNAEIVGENIFGGVLRGDTERAFHEQIALIQKCISGDCEPRAEPDLFKESASTALVDANNGPGQLAGLLAARAAIEKARESGICTVGIANGVSYYRAGQYAENISWAGMAGLVFCNVAPTTEPINAGTKLYGNSIAMAIPGSEGEPVLFETNEELISLQGHKGFGLLLSAELLAGVLDAGHSKGCAVIAINPDVFVGNHEFRSRVGAYVSEVKASRKSPDVENIQMPGEAGFRTKQRLLDQGQVRIKRADWDNFRNLADQMKIEHPLR